MDKIEPIENLIIETNDQTNNGVFERLENKTSSDNDIKQELLDLANQVTNFNFETTGDNSVNIFNQDNELNSLFEKPAFPLITSVKEEISSLTNHYESLAPKIIDTNNNRGKQLTSESAISDQDRKLSDPDDLNKRNSEEDETSAQLTDEEFKLPELDWVNLEAKLKIAQQEVNIQVFFTLFNY